MDRRRFLMGSTIAGLGAAGLSGCAAARMFHPVGRPAVDPEVEELQKRTFDWFQHVTPRETGLTPDRWPTRRCRRRDGRAMRGAA